MNAPPNPQRPPFNDQLAQALSPIQQLVNQRQKVEEVMRKYGRQPVKDQPRAPAIQWEGDPNG